MNRIRLVGALSALLALVAIAAVTPSHGQTKPARRTFIGSVLDSGQFLPDTAVIARVGKRSVTVWDFRDGYYAIYPEIRPSQDSVGRAEFLANIVKKEILGQTANAINRPLNFEDRASLKMFGDRLLANVLYGRTVGDSVDVSETELRRVYGMYGVELRIRHLLFTDRAEAERVRLQLLRGLMSWSVASTRYAMRDSAGKPVAVVSDWLRFETIPPDISLQIWPLKVGEYSPLLITPGGYHLVQVMESRKRDKVPLYDGLRTGLKMVLRQVQVARYRKAVQEEAMAGFDLKFDTTVVAFASSKFREAMKTSNDGFSTTFTFDARVPEFLFDESRKVIARWSGGADSLTIGDALHEYSDLPIIGRPTVNTPEDFTSFCLNVILEPRLVEVAKRRGMEQDSTYKALMARKLEEIRVTHMVEDSVFSRVVIGREDRLKYYREHLEDYRTYPSARYAMFIARTKATADSLKGVLDRGADPAAVVEAWHAKAGEDQAKIDVEMKNQPTYVHKIVFEELRPGQSTVNGPDREQQWVVVKFISSDDGRILSYEEAEHYVDETLQNTRAQQALDAFTERLRGNFEIRTWPERLMKIRLVDTMSDD